MVNKSNLTIDYIIKNAIKEKINNFKNLIKRSSALRLYNVASSLYPYIINSIKNQNKNSNIIIIFEKFDDAENFYNIYVKKFSEKDIELLYPITLFPYEFNEIDIISNFYRIKTCNSLLSINKKIVVTSLYSIIFPLIDPLRLAKNKLIIRKGQIFDRDEFIERLVTLGFNKKNYITSVGDFTVKGELISIYYDILRNPVKIDFFDNQIESIKEFEKDSEKLLKNIDRVTLLPLNEFEANSEEIKKIISHLYDNNKNSEELQNFILDIQNGKEYAILWNLGTIKTKINFITDYLTSDDIICFINKSNIKKSYEHEYGLIKKTYKNLTISGLSSPEKLFLDFNRKLLNNGYKKIDILEGIDLEKDIDSCIDFHSKVPEKFKNRIELFKSEYNSLIYNGYNIYIVSLKNGIKRFKLLFKDDRIKYIEDNLQSGFIVDDNKIAVYSEYDILNIKIKSKANQYKTEFIENKLDLKEGDFVVHIVHGIGQYLGVKKLQVLGEEKDFLHLKYKDNEDLFLPVENIGLIQKYIGFGTTKPKIDKLGGKTWKKTVEKTKEQIYEWAKNLYKLYEERKQLKGIAFPPDDEEMKKFEKKFPYKETYDQYKAIRDVKSDMEQPCPMDRLICGDVGFGKTEVAIRAAFKAAMAGYQVVLIAPTTILASQHYKRFKNRFNDYPIRVELLSRLVAPNDQKRIIEDIKEGKVDIIIGTHRVLSNDVEFKNPGLLIIDEEQKFGVEAKEKIKFLKHNIDVLSLTATPIPRTLYMSLMKIMQISMINTPPEERIPIQVYLEEFNDKVIKYAIEKEISRGGKVFFVHNRVETIVSMTNYLKTLTNYKIPIAYAHGRMRKNQIKSIIEDFINDKYKVLVSTTIIESGIDIPDVDTIIIDRADRFGLSNLYQLKGRVGRRSKLAYAYLLYPSDMIINEIALKRLQIIADYSELGSGYKIALKDLEIRGAGNILGKEQSGFISNVGFYMYQDLLKETVEKLQKGEKINRFRTEIELDIDTKIPEDIISNREEKIELYEKFYNAEKLKDLESIRKKILNKILNKNNLSRINKINNNIRNNNTNNVKNENNTKNNNRNNIESKDNFITLPESLENLIYLNKIRILAVKKKIAKILEEKEDILIIFDNEKTNVKTDKVIHYLKNKFIIIKPEVKNTIYIKNKFISSFEKLQFIEKVIKELF